MSDRAMAFVLWGVFFFLLPVPFFMMGGVAWAPLLRLSALASLMMALGLVDGVEGLMSVVLAIVLVQWVFYVFALWFGSRSLLSAVRRWAGKRFQALAVGSIALALAVASLFPIYTTPMSSTAMQVNVVDILD